MKPYLICHMHSSVDGRILGSRWRPSENRMEKNLCLGYPSPTAGDS